jgi:MoxR-like ATPase
MGLWKKVRSDIKHVYSFEEIVGHDDIKQIFVKAILSKRPIHLLLVGSPGSAKTMFLTEIMRHEKPSYFIVGSNTTKAGLVNQLFERRPKFLLIDELEKMSTTDQTALLHLMETGIISETKINKTREMELTSWVFATANSCEKIIKPLLSRFAILEMPEYTFEEFTEIAVIKLRQENVDVSTAKLIAEKVWNELGSRH